jgi:hypothetical protein
MMPADVSESCRFIQLLKNHVAHDISCCAVCMQVYESMMPGLIESVVEQLLGRIPVELTPVLNAVKEELLYKYWAAAAAAAAADAAAADAAADAADAADAAEEPVQEETSAAKKKSAFPDGLPIV